MSILKKKATKCDQNIYIVMISGLLVPTISSISLINGTQKLAGFRNLGGERKYNK